MTLAVSEKATEELKDELIRRVLNTGLGYRIISKTSESGRVTFSMELDEERPGDEVVTSLGIRIFLDPADVALLKDYELDYLDEPGSGFCLKKRRSNCRQSGS